MRYKVVVTKVEVAELWVRATNEEAAEQKVKDELKTSWAYAGHWERKATQVDVIESDPESLGRTPQTAEPSGPMLLKLKDAAAELGVSYGTLHALMKEGGIEYTKVGSSKYISRASLAAFVEANTQR
ncbi:helix-turn-helix domain-containing protein [Microbacterium sp. NPDC056057]|uniref:helix-turn-helix domain-containing protein n=1 Tax=Microbacterium sp. NPDC056057 TaxID=3345699 RepID=UPI0035E23DB5